MQVNSTLPQMPSEMSDPEWKLKKYLTKDALKSIEDGRGAAYFVPEGYTPLLVPMSQTYRFESYGLAQTPQLTSYKLDNCRVPGYIMKNIRKQNMPARAPRPPNAFILYRKEKQSLLSETNPGMTNAEVSKLVGQLWKEESNEVKLKYFKMSECYKTEHEKLYPNYKYQPRTRKSKNYLK
ncbi:M-specific HMG-box DNA-binding transcription factor Mc at silenced MAT2 locus [Schizosaccharomyces osmophilus]|uniref:M-specific HMG-box DNA-binding transcription factor Mc at silenced MAT2 locus n=1 Tax=Schizosaccharomyces osmophilus TaxID=2545709 RepID=A0AAE9WAE7_9SCHI|nr:M-specific HMG-box DNA-binding transcription factor Mc at silenced MAT2 locus [Schizosaccharomyces osmophilus]WBW72328.1 M-specific HMG-box DNA-binding transcription factor Mc at silenced MAT2 locus [Schizosaccharomyces osmophilus]